MTIPSETRILKFATAAVLRTAIKRLRIAGIDACFFVLQFATYPLDRLLSWRIGLQNIGRAPKLPKGTLVLANHRSMFDPFLVTLHLERKNWLTVVPMRYPVVSYYARKPILGPIITALGAYNIGETTMERAKRLLFTRELLDRKRTVLLFPEGKIVDHGHLVEEFKQGARMLFAHDYPVVFARLLDFNTDSFVHPKPTERPRLYFSEVVRGSAEEKIARMERFFSSEKPE